MPFRKIPIAAGEIYHVFNRSVARQPIFLTVKDFSRAVECIKFYLHGDLPLRFSHYNRLPMEQKDQMTKKIQNCPQIVEILSFCLMPNHVHFLLKSLTEKGIIQFMSNFQNSYAKYFNLRTDRNGTLFQAMFKAVRIETDEQLVHVNRYIHLNPITAYIVNNIMDLENYPWSSYPVYCGAKSLSYLDSSPNFITKEPVLSLFKDIPTFKKFTADQVDYQRKLDEIKHLVLE